MICTLPLLSILLSPRGHTQNTGLPGTFQTSASWFFPPFCELGTFPSESLFRSLRNCFSVVLMINHNSNHVKYLLYLYYDIYFILFCFQFSFARTPARRVNILVHAYPIHACSCTSCECLSCLSHQKSAWVSGACVFALSGCS